MRSSYTKRIEILEKRLNASHLRIQKFTEEDTKEYVRICDKFNKQFPGAVSFVNIETEDPHQVGQVWAQNLARVLAYASIRNELNEPQAMEWWKQHGLFESEEISREHQSS